MARKKVLVPSTENPAVMTEAEEVPIKESIERWCDVELEDGTTFKMKINIVSVSRIPGEYDPVGNPAYVINGQPTIAITHVPEALKKPAK